jgi:23S rRNA pseudouridine2604 synthase
MKNNRRKPSESSKQDGKRKYNDRPAKKSKPKKANNENKLQSESPREPRLDGSKRLNKFISESGICSRREADKFIEMGKVTLNGKRPEMGARVMPGDSVKVNGKLIRENKELPVYIMLNKPVGITCTTEKHVQGNIVDFVNHPKRIFPIGRLDKPSEGLIFLTNDGDIINKILRAGNEHDKEYIVTVDKAITDDFIKKMAGGIPILDTVTQKCKVTKLGKCVFKIVLTEGLNRQIRRMCEYLGYDVRALKRTRIMNVKLGDLPVGKWRNITKSEMEKLNKSIKNSVMTEEASKSKDVKTSPKTNKKKIKK